MTAQPGADELRIRSILRQRQVGPDAIDPPPVPPKPAVPPQRKRDWLDDILDGSPTTPEKPQKRRAPTVPEEPAETDETDPDDQEDEDRGEGKTPRWDPLAVTDRIVHAYQQRPASVRLRHAADVVVASKARFGQLVYTASGVWAAWRLGFTPWLLHHTATAPVGIPVVVLFVGWRINRSWDGAPLIFAWAGRAIYTATVVNLVLHP